MSRPAPGPAERLLRDLGIASPEDIDLEVIAWHCGVTIKPVRLNSCEACIVGNGKHAVICVDQSRMPERQRFSIGHELGHWHHHRGQNLICRADDIASGSTKRLEREADEYASEILLPQAILKECLRDYRKIDLKALREVSGRFGTSLTATAIAIARTDRFPIAVVCSRNDGRQWAARAQCISRRYRLRTDLDPEGLPRRMLNDPLEPESKYASLIGADAWFENERADQYDVREQCYRSSAGEVVSTITIEHPQMVE